MAAESSSERSEVAGSAAAEESRPLRLDTITIRGFRSLRAVGPVTLQSGLTALTGENDGGKSSFIDAVGFLLGTYAGDDGDCSSQPGGSDTAAMIEVEGRFVAQAAPALAAPVIIRARRGRGGSRLVELLGRRHPWLDDQPARLTVAALKVLASRAGLTVSASSRKEELVAVVDEWLARQPGGDFIEHWRPLGRDEEQRLQLPRFTRFSSAAAQDPKAVLQSVIQREARALLSATHHAAQLGAINAAIERELALQLAAMRAKMLQYCPDLDDVGIDVNLDFTRPPVSVSLMLSHDGTSTEVDVDKVGEGRRRRLTLALYEVALTGRADQVPTSSEILAYDEPDTHLDYSSQHRLFDILQGQASQPNIQVLVATHSLHFIDRVPLEALRHFRLGADRATSVRLLAGAGVSHEEDFLAGIRESLGLHNSMLLDERVFLIVEGETEQSALPGLFLTGMGRRLNEMGIILLNAAGVGAMRPLVDFLVKTCRKRVVLLIDSDTRQDPTQRLSPAYLADLGLDGEEAVHYVGQREFEDAFSDATWQRILADQFPTPADDDDWQAAEIAHLRSATKFSDALVSQVSRRHRGYVRKPTLGLALANHCTADDIPDAVQRCFLAACRLANARR